MHRILVLMVVAGLWLVSCGGDSTCQKIGTALCEKACSCREGPTCAIEAGLTFTFDSESDCRGFFVGLACSGGDMAAYNDAEACLPLVQAATCTGTGTEAGVSLPTDLACETPE